MEAAAEPAIEVLGVVQQQDARHAHRRRRGVDLVEMAEDIQQRRYERGAREVVPAILGRWREGCHILSAAL